LSETRRPNVDRLNRLLAITLFLLLLTGGAFAYVAADHLYHRPLHPVAAAAELSPTRAQGVLQPVTPSPGNEATLMDAGLKVVVEPISQSRALLSTPMSVARSSRSVPTASDEQPINDRINILLLGVDSRPGHSLVSRTDTIMLLSVSPDQKQMALLSIPRDLYVEIPGHGRDRINTAFVYGAAGNNLAGGAALLMQTVANTFGVAVDHYVLVDFSAVIKTVDTLGGVDLYVPYTIDDPTFPDMAYGYDPLYIPAGLHHFDGETALKYARTRHQDNDFYRAQRQQQLLFAIGRQVQNLGLSDLLSRAPTLYERVKAGVFTSLSLEEIARLARTVGELSVEEIQTAVLDYNYVVSYRTEAGAHVLILKAHEVESLVERLFFRDDSNG
jgi:polyisoprenyl-teichoic acid--peptidoglycan teichoic acid transferase